MDDNFYLLFLMISLGIGVNTALILHEIEHLSSRIDIKFDNLKEQLKEGDND